MDFHYKSATCRLAIHGDGNADVTHVYSIQRGKGHASGLLRLVTEYADSNDLQLYLLSRGYGGPVQTMLPPDDLIQFYEKFGFVILDKLGAATRMRRPRTKNTPYSEREN